MIVGVIIYLIVNRQRPAQPVSYPTAAPPPPGGGFCPQCGKAMAPGTAFCGNCGAKVG